MDADEGFRILSNIYDNKQETQQIGLSAETENLLLSHQYIHVINLIAALSSDANYAVLDGSLTGTGKTYTTAAICRELNRRPFIVCLKSNVNVWRRVLTEFGVDPIAVVNYDMIRTGKYFETEDGQPSDKPVDCPYITRNKTQFKWDFDEFGKKNVMMVFDEVHVCKNNGTLNAKLLLSCRSIKTLMLSATLCDKMADFGVYGYMMGYYNSVRAGKGWIEGIMRKQRSQIKASNKNPLHDIIFKSADSKGSRMTYDDIDDAESDIRDRIEIECYSVSPSIVKQIDKLYKQTKAQKIKRDALSSQIKEAKTGEDSDTINNMRSQRGDAITEIAFRREKIENIKAEIMYEQARSYYDSRSSVVMFVNYRSTHQILCDRFRTDGIAYSVIHGGQSTAERDEQIEAFQNDEVRIMISMIQAGGSSVSLHDTSGLLPRVSLISPSFAVTEIVQTLGRIKRSGTKTPTIQKIVYCAGTYEESLAVKISEKEEIMCLMTGSKKVLTSNAFKNAKKKKVSAKTFKNGRDGDNAVDDSGYDSMTKEYNDMCDEVEANYHTEAQLTKLSDAMHADRESNRTEMTRTRRAGTARTARAVPRDAGAKRKNARVVRSARVM